MLFYGNMFYGYYFDPTYSLVLIGVVICAIASGIVRSTFNRYSRVRSMSGYTGAMAAEAILHRAGIYDVRVERISGNLTDHYDPRSKILRLSDSVYNQTSVAAIGVAAHEVGHAIQHARGYVPLRLRSAIVPVVNIGSKLSWLLIFAGILIGGSRAQEILWLGILLFSTAVVFQLITLPVEFNASRRAVNMIGEMGILSRDELSGTRKVLSAAALTYVAGAISSILQLLRLIILFGGRRRD